jgi:hypothetical protein
LLGTAGWTLLRDVYSPGLVLVNIANEIFGKIIYLYYTYILYISIIYLSKIIQGILMYGAEVWQIPTREINKILSTEIDVLRRSARKSRLKNKE